MKPAARGPSTFHLATFGCQMNVYDSNLIAELLERKGMRQTTDTKQADIIIVNTCSVRGGAEERAYARIASMRHLKKRNPQLKIAVVGCMAQNHREKIPQSLKHVDFVVGPDNYHQLERLISDPGTNRPVILTEQDPAETYPGIMAKLDSQVSVMVAIMRGCNKACSYCIVPKVRGRERSRSPEQIEAEIQRAVSQGVAEVTLLGQTVNSYRYRDYAFSDLLKRLNTIDQLKRIRFTSPHPSHCTQELIATMAKCQKVCNHIHLPVQSGSDRILKKMRRGYSRIRYLETVKNLKEAMPNLGITTDIITGFIGETGQDFQDTLSLVKEVKFDSAFMFAYSPREGTSAYKEKENLSQQQKHSRLQKLIDLQTHISKHKADGLVGRTEEILLEGPSKQSQEEWVGKTQCFKKVVTLYQPGMKPGDIVKVNIKERRGVTLAGDVVL